MTSEEVRTEEGMPPALPETEVSNEPPPVAQPEDTPEPAEPDVEPESVPVP